MRRGVDVCGAFKRIAYPDLVGDCCDAAFRSGLCRLGVQADYVAKAALISWLVLALRIRTTIREGTRRATAQRHSFAHYTYDSRAAATNACATSDFSQWHEADLSICSAMSRAATAGVVTARW
jgi:hypothetical protein